jgi:histidinol-phosphatase (PHP family)
MKVDYHVHLEEGPYSLRWWSRTAEALLAFHQPDQKRHTQEWMEELSARMARRMNQGAFSPEWLDLYRVCARELGLREVGIVDHLYRFKEFKPYFEEHMHLGDDELGQLQRVWLDQVCTATMDDFVAFIGSQQSIWEADGISLRLGLEADYFVGGETVLAPMIEQYPWDHPAGRRADPALSADCPVIARARHGYGDQYRSVLPLSGERNVPKLQLFANPA